MATIPSDIRMRGIISVCPFIVVTDSGWGRTVGRSTITVSTSSILAVAIGTALSSVGESLGRDPLDAQDRLCLSLYLEGMEALEERSRGAPPPALLHHGRRGRLIQSRRGKAPHCAATTKPSGAAA